MKNISKISSIIPSEEELETQEKLEKEVCAITFMSIQKACELTEKGVNKDNPMIVGLTKWHDFLYATGGHKTVFSPQTGFITEDIVFTTTRDGWTKLGTDPFGTYTLKTKPKIAGKVDEKNRRYITVLPNSEGGSPFDDSALPSGTFQVKLFETGDITVKDRGEAERKPTKAELKELKDIFTAIYMHLDTIEKNNTEVTSAELTST